MTDNKLNKIKNIFIFIGIFPIFLFAQPGLPTAHSHNDYLHKRPLYEAIELGFGSIEIDICLTNKKELKVAHVPWFLAGKKDIEELYFAPIAKMIEEKDPRFNYSPQHPLNLLIDFKKNADSTYKYLKVVFIKYSKYITQYYKGKEIYKGELVINITGNKPWKALMNDSVTYARIDGSLWLSNPKADCPTGFAAIDTARIKYIGRVATNYKYLMKFKKKFTNDEDFYAAVRKDIQLYNDAGITTRYYEVPNNEKAWEIITKCGLNWVNVDKLKRFSAFYNNYKNN